MQQILFPDFAYPASTKVTELPLRDQPVERVLADSAACNSVELLATLLNGPRQIEVATQLLAKFGGLSGVATAGVPEIAMVKGVGRRTAARLKAALQLGMRAAHESPERRVISSPADAYSVLYPYFFGKEQEFVYVLMLDTRNRVIGQPVEIYHGTLNSAWIRLGELFREAIRHNAASIVLSHNHPSQDPSPSPDDVAVTRQAREAGQLLDVELHDHIIVATNRFVSMRERALGFS